MNTWHRVEANLLCRAVHLLTGASAYGLQPLTQGQPRVFFANHSSHLDAVVLWSSLPPDIRGVTRPVAAADYWTANAVRRHLATKVFNAVLVHRPAANELHEAAEALDTLLNALDEGWSLIIFPEGTRRESSEDPSTFKSGIYYMAKKRPTVEFVPVYLDNLSRILPKGELLPVPILSAVRFGTAIKFSEGENKAEFLERASAAMNGLKEPGA